jgi:hypothetical protein
MLQAFDTVTRIKHLMCCMPSETDRMRWLYLQLTSVVALLVVVHPSGGSITSLACSRGSFHPQPSFELPTSH